MSVYRKYITGAVNFLTGRRDGGGYQTYVDGAALTTAVSASGVAQEIASVSVRHEDVGETLTPVASFFTNDAESLGIQMAVEDNALDAFAIRYKYAEDGSYITRASAAVDFTTPNAPILSASGSFVTAAVGNSHWIKLDVSGAYAVQLWAASGNAAGSKIEFNGVAK